MNPVGKALEFAARHAKTRTELSGFFDDEFSRVEFLPEAVSVVVNINPEIVHPYFLGDAADIDLALSVTPEPGAIWWACLPRLSAVGTGLRMVARHFQAGASRMILQTRNPVVIDHSRKLGFRLNEIEPGVFRVLAERANLRPWLESTALRRKRFDLSDTAALIPSVSGS